VIAWILAFILLRTKWNTLPSWLQHLALMPYRRLLRNPFQRLLRAKLLQKATATQKSGAPIIQQEKEQSRLERALSKTNFFGGSRGSNDLNDVDDGSNILRKLQNAMSLAQVATDSVAFEGFQMQVALLVMLQMVDQSKKTTVL
jgi:hypothetical protein